MPMKIDEIPTTNLSPFASKKRVTHSQPTDVFNKDTNDQTNQHKT